MASQEVAFPANLNNHAVLVISELTEEGRSILFESLDYARDKLKESRTL